MTYDAEELKQYPEIMNKEQLRKDYAASEGVTEQLKVEDPME